MPEIRDILIQIGYHNLSQQGDYYRCKPLYRAARSAAPLSINRSNGTFFDFGLSEGGSLEKLIVWTINCSEEEAKQITQSEYSNKEPIEYRMEDIPLILNSEEIKYLIPAYQYFNNRNISTETLKHYKGGLATQGKMSDRFTFPIINKKGKLVGLSGRDVTNKKEAKWKNLGHKRLWDYPFYFNKKEINEANEVILIEGISDLLTLHEVGIKNVLVLFGLSCGKELLTTLLTLNKNIWICTNNDLADENGRRPGVEAAAKLKNELKKWFSEDKIKIKLPVEKDFGEMFQKNGPESIINWYKVADGGQI